MRNPFSITWLAYREYSWVKKAHMRYIKMVHPSKYWFKLYIGKLLIEFFIPSYKS